MLRPLVPLLGLLIACEPSLGWTVTSICTEGEIGVAVETGDCGSRSGLALQSAAGGDALDVDDLDPGLYCLSTLAFERSEGRDRENNGFTCRLLDVDSQTRDLPAERDALVANVSCEAPPIPTAALDTLLQEVAGCCPECDVRRCTCSASCQPDPVDGRCGGCPSPVQARSLVMADHFACALALDRRALHCWGDGEARGALLGDRLGEAPGVAHRFDVASLRVLPPSPDVGPDDHIFAMAADQDRLCFNLRKSVECVGEFSFRLEQEERDLSAPFRIAVSGPDFCIGEARPVCRRGADETRYFGAHYRSASELTGTGGEVCALVAGDVYCSPSQGMAVVGEACGPTRPCPEGSRCTSQCDGEGCMRAWRCSPDPLELPIAAFALDSGWNRHCVVTALRDVFCAEVGGRAAPVLREDASPLKALDVSVGDGQLCVLGTDGRLACGRLALREGGYLFDRSEVFPVANVSQFAAGPDGVSCAIRVEDSTVVCHQLAAFVEDGHPPSPLLGTANTSALESTPPVCP